MFAFHGSIDLSEVYSSFFYVDPSNTQSFACQGLDSLHVEQTGEVHGVDFVQMRPNCVEYHDSLKVPMDLQFFFACDFVKSPR